jgi:hypothetical protein
MHFLTLNVPVTATRFAKLTTVRHNYVEIYTEFHENRSRNVVIGLQRHLCPYHFIL